MGDGGFIAQFFDTETNELVGASGADWKCLVIHQAPLDKSCESSSNPVAGEGACAFHAIDEPVGWKSTAFNDSVWPNAAEYSASAIDPKGGYDGINWHSDAALIWSDDLETDNTVLCRASIE